jgi:hypothetical protein
MVTKHFFKVLFIFTGMIVLGLVSIFLASRLDSQAGSGDQFSNKTEVAK